MRHPKQFFALIAATVMMLLMAGTAWAVETEKININTASKKELTQLHRIGPALAERIIEYRKAYGLFKSPGDMTMVSGIGSKTFEINKDRITVDEPDKKPSEEDNKTPDENKTSENKEAGTDKAEDEKDSSGDKESAEE